ncbi:MAG: YlbF family regulator [Bacilli bacterium]|nr:YlbF family regulator [Bacilli bacterium]
MIESRIEELFYSIENSKVYQEYKKMKDILDKDSEIKELIDEIKSLEKEATYLENIGDNKYLEIDKIIKEKEIILNNKQVYIEYLDKMNEFNDELAISSKMISDYIEEKV